MPARPPNSPNAPHVLEDPLPVSIKGAMHVDAEQPLPIKPARPNGDATSGAEEGDERAHVQPHLLSLSSLVILIFFEVSGGPFGTEVRP
ncbi:hypothetical protein DUNSADRAFT_17967 [Dunaliella salina]|uniref:Encoded protein n=1 Tax=Dunaliella salina TaxID=3046 RepID=A0ABQ7GZL7_DUNSA|nr:hypothetical protein DUNSADRAFT_17967 [Dunaliella salina]|eukprot:KAF5840050.1 hypothetical protein DUNSADRAFT_17967 [Dunaliella salina]